MLPDIVPAPPAMQPWTRQTNKRLASLEGNVTALQGLTAPGSNIVRPVSITNTVAFTGPSNALTTTLPANSTVNFTTVSGMVLVMISAALQAGSSGVVGVGCYGPELARVSNGGVPATGPSAFNPDASGVTFNESFSTIQQFTPGTHSLSLYYLTNTTVATGATSGVLNATLIVIPL